MVSQMEEEDQKALKSSIREKLRIEQKKELQRITESERKDGERKIVGEWIKHSTNSGNKKCDVRILLNNLEEIYTYVASSPADDANVKEGQIIQVNKRSQYGNSLLGSVFSKYDDAKVKSFDGKNLGVIRQTLVNRYHDIKPCACKPGYFLPRECVPEPTSENAECTKCQDAKFVSTVETISVSMASVRVKFEHVEKMRCRKCKLFRRCLPKKCHFDRDHDELTSNFIDQVSDGFDEQMIENYENALRVLGGNMRSEDANDRKLAELVHEQLTNEENITNLAETTRFKPETIDKLKQIRKEYA